MNPIHSYTRISNIHAINIDETGLSGATPALLINLLNRAGSIVQQLVLYTDSATPTISLTPASAFKTAAQPVSAAPAGIAKYWSVHSITVDASNLAHLQQIIIDILDASGKTGAEYVFYTDTKTPALTVTTQTVPPAPPPAPPPPSPPPPSPPPISPDGSVITGGTGSLQTADGTWTFGPAAGGRPGEFQLFINGAWLGTGIAQEMEVANGGKIYALTASGGWWTWQTGKWISTTNPNPAPPAPPPSPPPPSPPPSPPPVVTPVSITFSPSTPSIPDNAPAGAVITTAVVTMSDGTTNFTGSLSSSDTTGVFAISGMSIVTGRALTSADDGTHSTTITATQNGMTVKMNIDMMRHPEGGLRGYLWT